MGLTFLIAWFASVANAVWEQRGSWRAARGPVLGFAAALLAVLGFGVVRLASPLPTAPAVRVAAIAPYEDLFATISDLNPGTLMPGTPAQRAAARAQLAPIADDLLGRSAQAAQDGARIIAWGETAAPVLEEDVPTLVARAAALARQQGIYLQLGRDRVPRGTDRYPFLENRAILLDPSGRHRVGLPQSAPDAGREPDGRRRPAGGAGGHNPVWAAGYGDLLRRRLSRAGAPGQPGRRGHPAGALQRLAERQRQHARMATFRAIEGGFWVVRPVKQRQLRGGRSPWPGGGTDGLV